MLGPRVWEDMRIIIIIITITTIIYIHDTISTTVITSFLPSNFISYHNYYKYLLVQGGRHENNNTQ